MGYIEYTKLRLGIFIDIPFEVVLLLTLNVVNCDDEDNYSKTCHPDFYMKCVPGRNDSVAYGTRSEDGMVVILNKEVFDEIHDRQSDTYLMWRIFSTYSNASKEARRQLPLFNVSAQLQEGVISDLKAG
uniref:Uncharacterized protein n=1 Tax=Ascaris lumbricoides TaxID=6252 RepID=A0A9J2PCL5_ASCLU